MFGLPDPASNAQAPDWMKNLPVWAGGQNSGPGTNPMEWIGHQTGLTKDAPTNPYQANEGQYADAIKQMMAQQAATGQQQDQQIGQLQAMANGQGPSVAQNMLNQATQANVSSGAAALGSARGMNPALAARMANENQVAMGQQAAGQGATMRSQEQMNAQQALAQALAQKRAQDAGMFGTMGQFQLGQSGLNAGVAGQNANLSLQQQMANQQMYGQMAGGLLGGVGGALGHALYSGGPVTMVAGGQVPGQAMVMGDSPRNDTVPAMVSPGEVVLPRSVTMAPNAAERAAEFVNALRKRRAV